MRRTSEDKEAVTDITEARAEYPATSDEMTTALEAGSLDRIMGEMTRTHRMRRVAQETGLGRESLYKSMRAGPALSSAPFSRCSARWDSAYR